MWALVAFMLSSLVDGFGKHINLVALTGGTTLGSLLLVNRVVRHLWSFDHWSKLQEQRTKIAKA